MAGIHEIAPSVPKPKRQPPHAGETCAVLRAYVAQFEELVQRNKRLIEQTETKLNSASIRRRAA
ncbi:MAG: hypothetical protein IT424_09290 [Pirellulales bacterium]|nr:hypothetical protein [Pirellulales bacterium]